MPLIIQKFGGSSIANIDSVRHIANKVIQTRSQGNEVVVVVSAMYGETDRLIALAKMLHDQPNPREYAMLLATGEQASVALLALTLTAQGCPARSYTSAQINILTNNHHKKANLVSINECVLRADLRAGRVPVVAGFQGISEEGDITLLGRGGSDTTAVALAATLKADECQIYKDVDGVYTADPKIISQAQRLDQITFSEMLELAHGGSKVIHQRAVEIASNHQVSLRVLPTFTEGRGTIVTTDTKELERPSIIGIASSKQEAKLLIKGLPHQSTIIGELLTALHEAHVDIDMLTQYTRADNKVDLSFTVSEEDYSHALELLNNFGKQHQAKKITSYNSVAKVSLVGVGLRSHPTAMSMLFKTLGEQSITVRSISTTELKLTVIMDREHVERAVKALHSAYGLDKELSKKLKDNA